jgi:hypothetical protein
MYMLVNEPNGRVYEAAIAGAQFFLLGGLVVALRSFNSLMISNFSLTVVGFLAGNYPGRRGDGDEYIDCAIGKPVQLKSIP